MIVDPRLSSHLKYRIQRYVELKDLERWRSKIFPGANRSARESRRRVLRMKRRSIKLRKNVKNSGKNTAPEIRNL